MGSATIVSNIGEGLYTIKLDYNLVPLQTELDKLNASEQFYTTLIEQALVSKALLDNDRVVAATALNAIIDQWQADLISKLAPIPPILPPDDPIDPDTGNPWADPDRAQEPPLLAAINVKRSGAGASALTRDSDLNTAALRHLRTQSGTNRMGHIDEFGLRPADRVHIMGYSAETTDELLSYGTTSPQNTVDEWFKSIDDKTAMLNPDATECGIAYIFSNYHPTNYMWCVLICKPGTPILTSTVDDPAKEAAKKKEDELQKIKVPETDAFTPDKLGEVARQLGVAVEKVKIADQEIARMIAEHLERFARITELDAIKAALITPIYAWCCQYVTNLTVGSRVNTAEIPGFWQSKISEGRYSTFGERNDQYNEIPDYEVFYTERPINIIPPEYTSGKLRHSTTINPLAFFYNCAMEPGTMKWKPAWRYGVITSITGNTCNVRLDIISERKLFRSEPAMNINELPTLEAVPIHYPPCNGAVFAVDDAVLIQYEGFDKTKPIVIGFRREPKPCFGGRTNWRQLI